MKQQQIKILIIEDDIQIKNFIQYSLQKENYQVLAADTGQKGISILSAQEADILILDLGLPDMEGLDVISQIRKTDKLPILVISARNQDEEKVEALDRGADDYLTKPFSVTELMARLRVAIRHMGVEVPAAAPDNFEVGKLKVDYESHMVFLDGKYIHLSPMEYRMVELLSHHAGKIMISGNLIKELWGDNYGEDTRGLRTLMAGLRRKLEAVPGKPRYIMTEAGIGYRMIDETDDLSC